MNYFIVDRICGDYVICENVSNKYALVEIKIGELPKNISEGDIIYFENEIYKLDKEKTKHRQKQILDKFNSLW